MLEIRYIVARTAACAGGKVTIEVHPYPVPFLEVNSAKGHASAGHTIVYETVIEPPERIDGLPYRPPYRTWSPTSPPPRDRSAPRSRHFGRDTIVLVDDGPYFCDVVRVISTMMLCGSSQAVAAQS